MITKRMINTSDWSHFLILLAEAYAGASREVQVSYSTLGSSADISNKSSDTTLMVCLGESTRFQYRVIF